MNNLETEEAKPLRTLGSSEENGENLKPIKYFSLFQFASGKDKALMIIGTLASIANGAFIPLQALLLGNITDTLADPDEVIYNAGMISLQFFGLGIGSWILSYLSFAFWMIAGERQGIEIRKRYFRSLLRQEIAFFDGINPNELSVRIASECFDIQGGIGEKVVSFVYSISMLFSGLIIGYIKGWQLALVLTAIVPLIGAAGSGYIYSVQKQTIFNAKCYEEAGGISEEALTAIKTVASLCGEEKETKRYTFALNKNRKAIVIFIIFSGSMMGLMMSLMWGMHALGFWYGSKLVEDGTENAISDSPYTGGDILTVFFSVLFAGSSLSQVAPAMKKFALAKAAGTKAFQIIFRESKISVESQEGLKPTNMKGFVEFNDVSFTYPIRPDRIVLDGVSFKANRNEKIALVGESGCGKTTCLQLLERFYDTQQGSVMVDGNDIRTLNLRWLRENIGYVGQEPVLFATSIKENLLIAKEDATDQELWDALKKANADDFVSHLPEKLDTFVGTNATQLSGGQKQRLAIARAILKNPCILILDEATSALDRKNEKEIQKTLDEISEGRTTITIAHRLTTIQNADRIFVFQKGKIVEEGKHEDLVAKKGVYYALQYLQLQNQDQNEEAPNQPPRSIKALSDGYDLEVANERPENLDKIVESPLSKNQEKGRKVYNLEEEKSLEVQPKSKAVDEECKENSGNFVALEIQDNKASTTQKAEEKKKDEKITSRLVAYNKDASGLLILGIIFAALNGSITPLCSIALANMIDVLAFPFAPDFHDKAIKYTIYFAALGAGALVINTLQVTCLTIVGENLSKKLRIEVFKKYLSTEIAWYDLPENAPGALCAKLATDASLVNSLASTLLGVFAQASSAFITGIVIAFTASWQLTLVCLAISPLMVIGQSIEAKFMSGFSDNDDKAYQESSTFVSEAVNNMRTVASFAREEKLLKSYSLKLQLPLKSAIKKGNVSGIAYGFSQFTQFCVLAVIFIIGAVLIVKINLGYKDLFLSVMAIFFAALGAANAMQYAPDVGAANTAASSIFKILDRKCSIRLDDPSQTVRTPIKGNIEFKNVWFRYPSRPKDILKGVSFKINAGTQVAFVGTSGCGKSTIMSLLQRFYDPTQGEILIDGIDIKKYDLHHLRSTFGVVSQEPVLFNGTIEYNIRYNQEKVSFEDIRQAAAEANALGFIERNEFDDQAGSPNLEINNRQNGFNKKVGPKGSQISGGQKQRIAIARAILKKPSVLLLDEATSALDAQSEKIVQESLDNIMRNKTAIIIAHRISTIRGTDEILVFNEGEVIERGKYEQLVQKRGTFYKLEQGLDLNS